MEDLSRGSTILSILHNYLFISNYDTVRYLRNEKIKLVTSLIAEKEDKDRP